MVAKGQDVLQVCLYHASNIGDGLEAGTNCPAVPSSPMLACFALVSATPQIAESFFDGPSSACLQIQPPQTSKPFCILFRKILVRIEPKIPGAFERVVTFRLQNSMLGFANRIDGLDHVLHHVEAVEDDLARGIWDMLQSRGDVRFPHVHGHGLNARQLLGGECLIIGIQTASFAVKRDKFDRSAIQVADQGHITMPLRDRFLVHSQLRYDSTPFGLQTSLLNNSVEIGLYEIGI